MDKPDSAAPRFNCDVEPHIRTEGEIQDLFPRMEKLADKLCQTSGLILWALKEAGLTIVRLDPHAREVAPDATAAPRQPEGPQDLNDEGLAAIRSSIEIAKRTGCSSITLEADEALRLIGQAERRRAQPADAATLGPEGEALRRALALIAREHGDGPGRGDMWAREIATAALAAKPVPDALLDEALDALRDALRDALLRYGCVGCALVMNSPDHPYYPAETMGYEAAMAFIRREAPKHKPQLDDRFHVPACKDDRARAVLRRSGRHEA